MWVIGRIVEIDCCRLDKIDNQTGKIVAVRDYLSFALDEAESLNRADKAADLNLHAALHDAKKILLRVWKAQPFVWMTVSSPVYQMLHIA